MSLVELALKKMQAARRARTPTAAPIRNAPALGRAWRTAWSARSSHAARTARSTPPAPRRRNAPTSSCASTALALRLAGLLPPEHQERAARRPVPPDQAPADRATPSDAARRSSNGPAHHDGERHAGRGQDLHARSISRSAWRWKRTSRVLLVDADVAKPHISRIFGVEHEPGLLDVLRDDTLDVESVILPTDVPNLSCCRPASVPRPPPNCWPVDRMEETMRRPGRAASPRRIVLIDSPPLLLTSESRALAQCGRPGRDRGARRTSRRNRPCSMRSSSSVRASRSAWCSTRATPRPPAITTAMPAPVKNLPPEDAQRGEIDAWHVALGAWIDMGTRRLAAVLRRSCPGASARDGDRARG